MGGRIKKGRGGQSRIRRYAKVLAIKGSVKWEKEGGDEGEEMKPRKESKPSVGLPQQKNMRKLISF